MFRQCLQQTGQACFQKLYYTPRNKLRQSFSQSVNQSISPLFCRRNSFETAQQNFLKLCSNKKHWCTHQSYGPKKFPREHYCFQKQKVSFFKCLKIMNSDRLLFTQYVCRCREKEIVKLRSVSKNEMTLYLYIDHTETAV